MEHTLEAFSASLEEIIAAHPPHAKVDPARCLGLLGGPTSIAYLMLTLSARHPDLKVQGHDLLYWANRFIEGDRGTLVMEDGCCGFVAESLALLAVRACVTKDCRHIMALLDKVPTLLEPKPAAGGDRFAAEMIYGRAGVLYMLRAVRHWAPDSAALVEVPMRQLAERIMDKKDDAKGNWIWNEKRYFGAPHGDIGTITQIVLCVPSLAPRLAGRVEELLDLQTSEGNWIHTDTALEAGEAATRIQFCHGAPGYVYAMQSLRPHYPALSERFNEAIAKARHVTWANPLLAKEPSLCHGLFGNGLALPKGEKRDHFLSLATPEAVSRTRADDAELFKPADYGFDDSALMGYWPSAAWALSVCHEEEPRMLLFNDV